MSETALGLLREFAQSDPLIEDRETGYQWCRFCDAEVLNLFFGSQVPFEHLEQCLWVRARAYLATVEGGVTG